jgi:hypothetical protein
MEPSTQSLAVTNSHTSFGASSPRRISNWFGPATRRAIAKHHKLGITAIYENHMMRKRDIDVSRQMRRDRDLTMRVTTAQESNSFGTAWSKPRALDEFRRGLKDASSWIEVTDDIFRFNGVKRSVGRWMLSRGH